MTGMDPRTEAGLHSAAALWSPVSCIWCWLCSSRCWACQDGHAVPAPIVTGPIIVMIGLTLAPAPRDEQRLHLLASGPGRPWPSSSVFNIWGKGMFKIIPILMGVVGLLHRRAHHERSAASQLPDAARRSCSPSSTSPPCARASLMGLPAVPDGQV
ncbi:MAG: hypothetical protein ACLU38_01660 [Dysosmobacter sp.]